LRGQGSGAGGQAPRRPLGRSFFSARGRVFAEARHLRTRSFRSTPSWECRKDVTMLELGRSLLSKGPARFVQGDWWRLPESPRAFPGTRLRRPAARRGGRGTTLPEHGSQGNRDGTLDSSGARTEFCRGNVLMSACRAASGSSRMPGPPAQERPRQSRIAP
jgi:hypothetical protein